MKNADKIRKQILNELETLRIKHKQAAQAFWQAGAKSLLVSLWNVALVIPGFHRRSVLLDCR